jgi:hypothetical protein
MPRWLSHFTSFQKLAGSSCLMRHIKWNNGACFGSEWKALQRLKRMGL